MYFKGLLGKTQGQKCSPLLHICAYRVFQLDQGGQIAAVSYARGQSLRHAYVGCWDVTAPDGDCLCVLKADLANITGRD